MQIFKRLNNTKPAQNVIEFVFILPILIFVTLVIFEVGLFWQDVNAIYNLNAEINANLALINPGGLNIGDTRPAAGATGADSRWRAGSRRRHPRHKAVPRWRGR